jgi:hypothetical protein
MTFNSSASTWGELKTELSSNNLLEDGLKYSLGKQKLTLENDGALLPNEDIIVIGTPKSVKSGRFNESQFVERLQELINEALETLKDEAEDGEFNNDDDGDDDLEALANELL